MYKLEEHKKNILSTFRLLHSAVDTFLSFVTAWSTAGRFFYKNTKMSTVDGFRLTLRPLTISPAFENTLSKLKVKVKVSVFYIAALTPDHSD